MTSNWYLIRYESVNQQIDIIYMIYYQDTTYYNLTTLQPYNLTTLQPYNIITLQQVKGNFSSTV